MSSESLREYEVVIARRANQLADALQAKDKEEVDLGRWLIYFTSVSFSLILNNKLTEILLSSVDFMADMAYVFLFRSF